jgi:hypothetical protein
MMSAKAQKYYARYLENIALAADTEESMPNDRGWSCVVRFYAALHLMTAYLVDKRNVRFNPASTEHEGRKNAMSQCPELRDAPSRYRDLKDLSQSVRYNAEFKCSDEDREDAVAWLKKIVAIVEPKLKRGS